MGQVRAGPLAADAGNAGVRAPETVIAAKAIPASIAVYPAGGILPDDIPPPFFPARDRRRFEGIDLLGPPLRCQGLRIVRRHFGGPASNHQQQRENQGAKNHHRSLQESIRQYWFIHVRIDHAIHRVFFQLVEPASMDLVWIGFVPKLAPIVRECRSCNSRRWQYCGLARHRLASNAPAYARRLLVRQQRRPRRGLETACHRAQCTIFAGASRET